MIIRSMYSASSDVIHSYVENSILSSAEGRTMAHMGLGTTLLPLSMLGLMLLIIGPALVAGQTILPGMQERDPGATLKAFSGLRANNDSLRQVYYHDQTIAVVELGPGKELLNCELVEVYANVDLALKKESLSVLAKPIAISFQDIQQLMQQCQQLNPPPEAATVTPPSTEGTGRGSRPPRNQLSLFSGIMPGTKWCGTGDIANTYFDLGEAVDIDKCCRTHDLCPAKVRAFQSRYNLTNYSLYTKSHCACDNTFYNCLKATNSPTASLMGNLYFNIVRVPCVEDSGCEGKTCERKKRFRVARKHF